MKKLNSILAIATVALSAVFGLTSCEKNDDEFTPVPPIPTEDTTQTPEENENKTTYEYQYFVSDNVLSLGDFEITVEQDGQSKVYKVSEGQTDVKKFDNANYDDFKTYQLTGRRLIIGNLKEGNKVTTAFKPNEAAISALPTDGTITFGILLDIFCNSKQMKHSDFGKYEYSNSDFLQGMNNIASVTGYTFN